MGDADVDDVLPDVDDFRLAKDLDSFDHKIAIAIGFLIKQGRGRHVIAHRLREHLDAIENGEAVPSMHARLALNTDEATGGKRRKELAEIMHAAGVMKNSDADTLTNKLSGERCNPRAARELPGIEEVVEILDGVLACEDVDAGREAVRKARAILETEERDLASLIRLEGLGLIALEDASDSEIERREHARDEIRREAAAIDKHPS